MSNKWTNGNCRGRKIGGRKGEREEDAQNQDRKTKIHVKGNGTRNHTKERQHNTNAEFNKKTAIFKKKLVK